MRRRLSLMGMIFFLGMTTVSYQNCGGNVDFGYIYDGKLGSNYYDAGLCRNGCWKNEMDAKDNVIVPDVKVVLVVDNSSSMASIQASLGRGIKKLVDGLRGFSASFYIYSTTQES